MTQNIDALIQRIHVNLQRVIQIADEISNEYRRTIHVDMTTKKTGKNIKLLRELLETDNLMRDTIAQLRKATSTISFNSDKEEILRDQKFLSELYENLSSMFRSFDKIYKVMEFEEGHIDEFVIDTIDSLEQLSSFNN